MRIAAAVLVSLLTIACVHAVVPPPPQPSPPPPPTGNHANWVGDGIGVGWELGPWQGDRKQPAWGKWTGTFTGAIPPPRDGAATVAKGSWRPDVPFTLSRKTSPHTEWAHGKGWSGAFTGPLPPSPPGPQYGVWQAWAGTWRVDSSSQKPPGSWRWHGVWTGRVTIK